MIDEPRHYYALAERPKTDDGYGLPEGTEGSIDLSPVGGVGCVFVSSRQPWGSEVRQSLGDGTHLAASRPNGVERDAWKRLTGVTWEPGWTLLDVLRATLTVGSCPDGERRCKPLMPTHDGRLEIHLGGHACIWQKRMPRKATDCSHWQAIQRVLQNDYRQICRCEGDINRKWLGAMARKYRLSGEAARDLLIPQGLPRELPLPPTTEIADDFNRSDRNLDGDEATVSGVGQGWVWSSVTGSHAIIDGRAGSPASPHGEARAEIDLSTHDHRSLAERYGSDHINVCCRFSPSANTHYGARLRGDGQWAFVRRVNGSLAVIQEESSDLTSNGIVIELRSDGSSHTVLADNEVLGQFTDSQLTGFLRTGLRSQGAMADNFFAADLLPEPSRRSSPFHSPVFSSPVFGGGALQ